MGRHRPQRVHVPHGWPEPNSWETPDARGDVHRPRPGSPADRKVRGAAGNARGRAAEQRLLGVLEVAAERGLLLLVSARLGTLDEDQRGIDIVVATYRGRLDVQVKASVRAADTMRARYESRGIMVVAVPPEETDAQLLGRFARALVDWRRREKRTG